MQKSKKDVTGVYVTAAYEIWGKNEGVSAFYIIVTNLFGSEEEPSALNSALSERFCPGVVHNKGFG